MQIYREGVHFTSWVYGIWNWLPSVIFKNIRNEKFGSYFFFRIPDFLLCFSLIWIWGCNSVENISILKVSLFLKYIILLEENFPSMLFQEKNRRIKIASTLSAGEAHFWHKCHPGMQRTNIFYHKYLQLHLHI